MPQVRRKNIPPALLRHLLDGIQGRKISAAAIGRLADGLDERPEVPAGPWFKRLQTMTVCGEGDLIRIFLLPTQLPHGTEIL